MKCFESCALNNVNCENAVCRHFIHNEKSLNCVIVAAKEGPMTLQQIGDIFGVTRMRICQLEKRIIEKIRLHIDSQ
jgi:DNA-binding CsgD family transcriptional regulator